jgi:hypothetical protein
MEELDALASDTQRDAQIRAMTGRGVRTIATIQMNAHIQVGLVTEEDPVQTWKRIPATEAQTAFRDEVIAAMKQGAAQKFIDSPDAKPSTAVEEVIKGFVEERFSRPLDKDLSATVAIPESTGLGGKVYFYAKGIEQRRAPRSLMDDPEVTAEFEAASTRIGKLVHEEIKTRVATAMDEERATIRDRRQSVADAMGVPLSHVAGNPDHIHESFRAREDGVVFSKEQKEAGKAAAAKARIRSMEESFHLSWSETAISNQVFRDVMSEARSMGGVIEGTPSSRKAQRGLNSNALALLASGKYPTEWVEASNLSGTVDFKKVQQRAHYAEGKNGNGEVTLDGSPWVATHELGHRMEDTVPGLKNLERHFYDRRTKGGKLQRLQKMLPGEGYRGDEEAIPDDFVSPYSGKSYGGRYYEVFTMGIQSLANHERKIDDDHAAFTLGALVTLLPGDS